MHLKSLNLLTDAGVNKSEIFCNMQMNRTLKLRHEKIKKKT